MSKADEYEYRARAVECEQTAKNCKDPEAKRQFEEAAREWRYMADLAQKYGR
jgi:hypothetical protein